MCTTEESEEEEKEVVMTKSKGRKENAVHLLKKPSERSARAAEKRRLLLRFLRTEIYTTPGVAAEVMGVGTRGSQATVTSMEKAGLVRRHRFTLVPGSAPQVVIGITTLGQSHAFDPDAGERTIDRVFHPERYNLALLHHQIILQQLRLHAEGFGMKEWLPGEMIRDIEKGSARPDSVLTTKNKVRVAVEVERTLKSRKRYEQIFKNHIAAIQLKNWDHVVFVSPDVDTSKRVQSMLFEKIPPGIHLARDAKSYFSFTTRQQFIAEVFRVDRKPDAPEIEVIEGL